MLARLVITVCAMFFATTEALSAQNCQAPSSAKLLAITRYIAAKEHVENTSVSVVQSSKASADCFWKLSLSLGTVHRDVTYYLSPDGAYLVPEIYDLASDPAIEERKRLADVSRLLTENGPPVTGSANPRVTVVEFSDFECPFCKRLNDVLENNILKENHDVRIVFKYFPLEMHPWAKSAAEMAACIALQDDRSFWAANDFLFAHQSQLNVANLHSEMSHFVASIPALDLKAYETCISKDLTLGIVSKDMQVGMSYGVHATPTLFINGRMVRGAQTPEQLHTLIEAARTDQAPQSK